MKYCWLLILALLAGCQSYNQINGCFDSYRTPNWEKLQQDLAQNRKIWQSKNLRSYTFTFKSGSWVGTFTTPVVVQDGKVVTPQPEPGTNRTSDGYSIESLFDANQAIILNHDPCETLEVKYHPTLGFPVSRGWAIVSNRIADAISGYQVLDFSPQ